MQTSAQRQDQTAASLDQNTSLNLSTLDAKRKHKKILKRELVNGKWQTIQEEDPTSQIAALQKELLEGEEVVKKLKDQRKKLDVQVKEITTLVEEKVKENSDEQKKKTEKTRENAVNPNRRQYNIQMTKLTEQQLNDRLRELSLEQKNAAAQQKILYKEYQKLKDQTEDSKVLDNIAVLENSIKQIDQDIVVIQQEIKAMEKTKKDNEKKIESIQGDRDDAAKLNRMTQEVFQTKEKIKVLEERKLQRQEETFNKYEKIIDQMLQQYEENVKLLEEKNIIVKRITIDRSYKDIDTNDTKKERDQRKEWKKPIRNQTPPIVEPEENKAKVTIPTKKKNVREIREEQERFEDLPKNEMNFLMLENKLLKLQKFSENTQKVQEKEVKDLQNKLNEMYFQISSLQQYTKEKEKEKDLAENKFDELKKSIKHQELVPLKQSSEQIKKLTLLELKKKELEEKKEFLIQHRKTTPNLPFSNRSPLKQSKKTASQINQSVEEKPIEELLDCGYRLSERKILGIEPDKETQICDDVNVVGQISVEHRIRKLTFFHQPQKGYIYGFQIEYIREDKKSTVAGQWQVNQAKKDSTSGTKVIELNIANDDWINSIEVEHDDKFIRYMKISTKRDQVIEIGKKSSEEQIKKVKFNRAKGSIPITIFGGFNQYREKKEKDLEAPLALSCFGVEQTQKMKYDEKNLIEEERKKKQEKLLREEKERQIRIASEKHQIELGLSKVEEKRPESKISQTNDSPKHEQPKHEQPKHEQPKHEEPKHEEPKHEPANTKNEVKPEQKKEEKKEPKKK